MIDVDLIGGIRRAYFEQRWPIKEIVRRLAVSRATVRRVIRSQKTEFKYERGGSCPGTWCSSLRSSDGSEVVQAATPGSLTRGSSLTGARLSRLM